MRIAQSHLENFNLPKKKLIFKKIFKNIIFFFFFILLINHYYKIEMLVNKNLYLIGNYC
jgi:hypothetical protein